ncbi:hypothetical protein QFC20_002627 [Naganishia adeliensis]|uniref:Uncharacterized protein n=1 Tax=Naganishia adeliensis TaxID=92952 RepID=A0ACC2WIS9_9TREE|nr:hypothetical protein QFC20_002627 [Naganishia adeliensis]
METKGFPTRYGDEGYDSEEEVDALLPSWRRGEEEERNESWEWTRARSPTLEPSQYGYRQHDPPNFALQEDPNSHKLPSGCNTPIIGDQFPAEEDEPQCRICFGGPSDEPDCGRLISPCLCSGSMRHVHVGCIQQWRGTGRNKKAFMECTQCGFRYRLRRTRILGLASSKPILVATSILLFLTLSLLVGSILHWMLHFKSFRRIVTGPYGDNLGFDKSLPSNSPNDRGLDLLARLENGEDVPWEEAFRQDPIGAGVRVGLPGGLVYVSTGSGIFELVVKSVRAFVNGEAEGVWMGVAEVGEACFEWLGERRAVRTVVDVLRPLHLDTLAHLLLAIPKRSLAYLQPLITRFTLGFSLIGSASFITLLITHSMMAPFHVLNNIRLGRGAGPFGLPVRTNRGRQAGARGGGVAVAGLGSAVLVLFVVAGAVRAIKQLYTLTNYYSFILLSKAENAILEVTPSGEVIPNQPGGLGSGIMTTDGSTAVIARL